MINEGYLVSDKFYVSTSHTKKDILKFINTVKKSHLLFVMISKILFLPIEFKSREFYPKLYFANKALDKNFACFFGDKAGIFRATKYFNNGIYFYKSINATDTNHIKAITKK